jgi:acetyl esterase/lipase
MLAFMKYYILLIIVFSVNSIFAQLCTQDNRFTEVEYFTDNEIDTILDIKYGFATNNLGVIDSLYLDAFFPNNFIDTLNKRPVVVMIHGGGFSGGQKEDRWGECFELAKRGFIAFSINYRLGWNQTEPSTQLLAMYRAHQDALAAIRYIVDNSSTYRVDTSWIFIGGTSAGANTANNLVYTNQSDYETIYPGIGTLIGNLNTSSNSLTNTFSLQGIFNNWGSVFINDIKPNELVPQIAFHGEADTVVSIDTASNGNRMGSRAIHNYLVAENVCSDITVKPGGGHGIYADENGTTFRISKVSCFFKSLFCNSCADNYANTIVIPDCSSTTSVEIIETDNEWTASPNPFNNYFNISNLVGNESMSLYDLKGSLIYSNSQIKSENLYLLPSGIYVLCIKDDTKSKRIKIIKE